MISGVNLDDNQADAAMGKIAALSGHGDEMEADSMMGSTMDFRKLMALVGAFYWFVMTILIVPTGCVCTLFFCLYPLMVFSKDWFNRFEHSMCTMVNDHWVAAGQYTGLNVIEYGEDISKYADKRCLLLSNHLGLVDHFCLMTAFVDKTSITGRYLWVIFNIWKYTPLGAMWTSHGNFFINGGASKREGVLQEFREHLRSQYWRYDYGWIVMYPEGSRLYLIRDGERTFAEKNGIKPFRHCAHPRTGAAHAVLSICGPQEGSCANGKERPPLDYVVDCTLGYYKGKVADLGSAMLGEWPSGNSNVAVHYTVHKVDPAWGDEEKLKEWLYKRYAEKDELLESFYKTGRFPGQARQVQFPLIRNLMVQAFWMALFYFHYNFWIRPTGLAVMRAVVALFV